MDLQYTLFFIIVLISAVITAALSFYAWRHRTAPGAAAFAWFMLLVAWLSLTETVSMLSRTPETALFWFNLMFVSLAGIPVAWLVFALQYTGRQEWLSPRRLVSLTVIPLITQAMIWTNEAHGLWSRKHGNFFQFGPLLIYDMSTAILGPWSWVHIAYSYLLILLALVLIVRAAIRWFHLYRGQAAALLLGAFLPLVGNVLYTLQLIPELKANLTSLGFTLGGLAFAWAMFRYRLLDVVPVARDTLVDNMSDGMIVLDAQGRIVDLNPAFRRVLGIQLGEAIGKPATQVLHPWQDLVERLRERIGVRAESQAEISLVQEGTQYHYDLRISPLINRRGHLRGWMIVLRDITVRKHAEEALQQRTLELEARNAELDAYAHTVAHDLKTPLNTVVSYAEMLRELHSGMPADAIEEELAAIVRSSYKMAAIIDALLLMASVRKLEGVELGPLDMASIVDDALTRLEKSVAESGAIIVKVDEWPTALGYDPWIEVVWANYISNAISYGGEPPRVELGADKQQDGMVRFWVRDNGRGLTKEKQEQLFAEFSRLDQVRVQGHGLGLSIVKRIVEKLGGQVGVESELEKGSMFYFTLPCKQDT